MANKVVGQFLFIFNSDQRVQLPTARFVLTKLVKEGGSRLDWLKNRGN
jgi:hypothetical protein